jgi:hypothetical protein
MNTPCHDPSRRSAKSQPVKCSAQDELSRLEQLRARLDEQNSALDEAIDAAVQSNVWVPATLVAAFEDILELPVVTDMSHSLFLGQRC